MADSPKSLDASRIAIVFVHGQGEQRPMEGVQELARTMWEGDPGLERGDIAPRTFTVPDPELEGADFARVTTETGIYTTKVDFFEFYWADLMVGNRFDQLANWFIQLQRRPRRDAPTHILTIRQFAIRFTESVLILAWLYAFSMSLMLRPPANMRDGETFFLHEKFGFPRAIDQVWMMGVAALGMVVLAWVVMIVNEATGGRQFKGFGPRALFHSISKRAAGDGDTSRLPDAARKLQDNALWSSIIARLLLGIGVVGFVLLVFFAIWLGPTFEWGDLKVVIFSAVALSASLAVFVRSQLVKAVWIALAAAATATVAAIFGGAGPEYLFVFDPASEFAKYFADFPPGVGELSFDDFRSSGGRIPWLLGILQTLQLFAAVWFVSSFFTLISAQRNAAWRTAFVLASVALSAGMGWYYLKDKFFDPPFVWTVFALGAQLLVVLLAVAILFGAATRAFLIPVMADSARYFSRDPDNVGARQEIRKRGLKLLNQLHSKKAKGPHGEKAFYDRVIIVAHSLGSAVAYELLMDFWSRQCGAYCLTSSAGTDLIRKVHELGLDLVLKAEAVEKVKPGDKKEDARDDLKKARDAFRAAQSELRDALAACKLDRDKEALANNWLITDFVTVGSPLAHASLLLANGADDLRERQERRKLVTCPPSIDPADKRDNGLTFDGGEDVARMLHSAMFGAVRWTNIYFKTEPFFVLEGDIIGGPVAPMFGPGVEDVEIDREDTGAVFTHNEYWVSHLDAGPLRAAFKVKPGPKHLAALKQALNLGDTSTFVIRSNSGLP